MSNCWWLTWGFTVPPIIQSVYFPAANIAVVNWQRTALDPNPCHSSVLDIVFCGLPSGSQRSRSDWAEASDADLVAEKSCRVALHLTKIAFSVFETLERGEREEPGMKNELSRKRIWSAFNPLPKDRIRFFLWRKSTKFKITKVLPSKLWGLAKTQYLRWFPQEMDAWIPMSDHRSSEMTVVDFRRTFSNPKSFYNLCPLSFRWSLLHVLFPCLQSCIK
jgi:hypothetical protein